MTCGGVSASCARRLSRLDADVRRLGTAIPRLLPRPLAPPPQPRPGGEPRRRRRAAAAGDVQVGAAARTEAPAVLAAERAGGQREDDLLVHERGEVDLAPLVETERQVLGVERSVAERCGRSRREHEAKGGVEPEGVVLGAPCAAAADE